MNVGIWDSDRVLLIAFYPKSDQADFPANPIREIIASCERQQRMTDSLQPQFAEVLTLIQTAQQKVIAATNQE